MCVRACARVHACVPTPCHRPPSPEVPLVGLGVDVDTLVGEQQLDHLGMVSVRRPGQSRLPAVGSATVLKTISNLFDHEAIDFLDRKPNPFKPVY